MRSLIGKLELNVFCGNNILNTTINNFSWYGKIPAQKLYKIIYIGEEKQFSL